MTAQPTAPEPALRPCPTEADQRAAGFHNADGGVRTELALRLLCAFNGVDPAAAPPGWWVHPKQSSRAAWERVAAVVEESRRAVAPEVAKRTDADYAIEFGHYLVAAAENFMAEQNRAWEAEEAPDPDFWRSLESAIYEFRKRADRADATKRAALALAGGGGDG